VRALEPYFCGRRLEFQALISQIFAAKMEIIELDRIEIQNPNAR
jgi:hypothetical protein